MLLEDDRGGSDTIDANTLGELLDPARRGSKLLILDACYSGAGGHAAARVQLGLDREPTRQEGAEGTVLAATAQAALPSLAQALSQRFDFAALAMRLPGGRRLRHRADAGAVRQAVGQATPLAGNCCTWLWTMPWRSTSPSCPCRRPRPSWWALRGRAAPVPPPRGCPQPVDLPKVGLSIGFPSEPERFVGRLQPMLRLARHWPRTARSAACSFTACPGRKRSSCAVELDLPP